MEDQTIGTAVDPGPVLPELPPIPSELFDPDGVLGKPFHLPGIGGHPFRGEKVPDLKQTDRQQPQIGLEGHAFVFDLANKKHLEYYEKIFHMAYNGQARIGVDRVDFDEKTGTYRAFVRWAFVFTHMKTPIGGVPRG